MFVWSQSIEVMSFIYILYDFYKPPCNFSCNSGGIYALFLFLEYKSDVLIWIFVNFSSSTDKVNVPKYIANYTRMCTKNGTYDGPMAWTFYIKTNKNICWDQCTTIYGTQFKK